VNDVCLKGGELTLEPGRFPVAVQRSKPATVQPKRWASKSQGGEPDASLSLGGQGGEPLRYASSIGDEDVFHLVGAVKEMR